MKASELRIGNYILFSEDNTIFEVGSIEEKGFTVQNKEETTWIEAYEFDPIPLTEEWLIKFGFSREVKVGSEMGTDGVEFRVYHFDVLTFNTNHGWWYKVQRINDTPLEYVHQLQNFYFAIKGKELTKQ
jgi:hypothetical protein